MYAININDFIVVQQVQADPIMQVFYCKAVLYSKRTKKYSIAIKDMNNWYILMDKYNFTSNKTRALEQLLHGRR